MKCVQGFTRQEDCTMCDACVTYGLNPCAKGLTDDERNSDKCDLCKMCQG